MLAFNTADFTFYTPLYAAFELGVLEFSGRESISEAFSMDVRLVTTLLDIPTASLIGQSAVLTIRGIQGTRYVRGIISRFELVSVGRKLHHYVARIVPTIGSMQLAVRSRIFQQKSAKDIVLEVLKTNGLPGDMIQDVCQETYAPRDYCVQYRESDLAFISRLMEEEGIFFYFDHSFEKDVLVLGDNLEACDLLELAPTVDFQDESQAASLEKEYLYRLSAGQVMSSGSVMLRDFSFKQPDLDMDACAAQAPNTDLEVYDYPGEYTSTEVGSRLAQVRLEALKADEQVYRGTGTCRALIPGNRFALLKHPRPDLNREYLIVSVGHKARQPGVLQEESGAGQVEETRYTTEVQVLPTTVPYRPPRRAPRPQLSGVQSAIVVGPSGEEIYCDEFGRVKVQFHWDRDGKRNEQSSCWIRVSQTWAGAAFGTIFIPRVGEEVLVQFLEADPDRPVIVGRVYNGLNPVPYPLPEQRTQLAIRTRSTPRSEGFNELRFQDRAGEEEIAMHAQRDLNEIVLRHHKLRVDGVEAVTVGGNQTIQVGDFQTTIVKKLISISSTEDEIRITSPKKILLEVGDSRLIITPSKVRIESPEINTCAQGLNNIFGGMVKINCDDPGPEQDDTEVKSGGVSIRLAKTNQAALASWADKQQIYQQFLKRLALTLTAPEVKRELDKLTKKDSFIASIKKHFPETLKGIKDLLSKALKDGRLPTLDELKALGAGAFASEVSKLLGTAVLDSLPQEWPEDLRKDLAALIEDGAHNAIRTAIENPEQMKEWAIKYGEQVVKEISAHLGEMAGEEVKDLLAAGENVDQSWAEKKLTQYLPEATEQVVAQGIPMIIDQIIN